MSGFWRPWGKVPSESEREQQGGEGTAEFTYKVHDEETLNK